MAWNVFKFCTALRGLGSIMILLVLGVVGVTYYAVVLTNYGPALALGGLDFFISFTVLILFHCFVSFPNISAFLSSKPFFVPFFIFQFCKYRIFLLRQLGWIQRVFISEIFIVYDIGRLKFDVESVLLDKNIYIYLCSWWCYCGATSLWFWRIPVVSRWIGGLRSMRREGRRTRWTGRSCRRIRRTREFGTAGSATSWNRRVAIIALFVSYSDVWSFGWLVSSFVLCLRCCRRH